MPQKHQNATRWFAPGHQKPAVSGAHLGPIPTYSTVPGTRVWLVCGWFVLNDARQEAKVVDESLGSLGAPEEPNVDQKV